jgi:VanZ family protein
MTTANLLAKNNWRFYTFSLFWAAIILCLSFWNGNDLPNAPHDVIAPDKMVHFILYFVFTFSVFIAFKKVSYRSGMKATNRKAFGVALVLSLITEGIQTVAIERTFDFNDLAANCFGIVIAGLVLRLILGKQIFYKLS